MKMKYFVAIAFVLLTLTGISQNRPVRLKCHNTRAHISHRPENEMFNSRDINASIARSDTFDIIGYEIYLDVTNYVGQTIEAITKITFSPKLAGNSTITLDLMQLTVDSVWSSQGNHSFSHNGMLLHVDMGFTLEVDSLYDLFVAYHGEPYRDPVWGGFYFESNYIYNLGIGLSTIPPNFGKVWYPCFDSFVERAAYTYHVKSAGGLKAHCQGDFLGEEILGGDTLIRSFEFSHPIPTHLSAIAVSNYVDLDFDHEGAYGIVPVRLTGRANQINGMQSVMQNIPGAIDACEYWYGAHAWDRVGYVLTTDGALEIPTNIAYPDYMTSQSVGVNNDLLSHELGHHWWGDVVTPHNHNDMWLKEGPAEYSSHLLEEWLYGHDRFIEKVKINHEDVLKNAHIDDAGFHPLSPMPDAQIYGTHTYYKGASVMHNLRGYLGDSLFRQGMSFVQQEYADTDMTPEQFRDHLEEGTGTPLDDFFVDQIFQPGFSVFVVDSFRVEEVGLSFSVQLFLQQKLRACNSYYHNVPLDISFISPSGDAFDTQVLAGNQFSSYTIEVPFAPAKIWINRFHKLNQARLDHEFVAYSDVSFLPSIPYTDLRIYKESVTDSCRLRVEHIWAAPDAAGLSAGIDSISSTHYWNFDGLINEGDHFSARFYYEGAEASDLDYQMFGSSESNAVLLYRKNASEPWVFCPSADPNPGSLTNGSGYIVVDTLWVGQYAFGKGDVSLAAMNWSSHDKVNVFPNPASDVIFMDLPNGSDEILYRISDITGKILIAEKLNLRNSDRISLDVSQLSSGCYHVHLFNGTWNVMKFHVSR
jgi:aminopeptidase N